MVADLLTQILTANLAASAAILLVLVLRRYARRWLGARLAYGLWLTVPAAMLASLAPARVVSDAHLLQPPFKPTATAAIEFVAGLGAQPLERTLIDPQIAVMALWVVGAAVFFLSIVTAQWRAVVRLGLIGQDAQGFARAANPKASPSLVGLLKPRIVLPSDFETKFTTNEQALILAHERTHLVEGHLWTNAFVGVLSALNWFNPLIHMAAHYLRLDQELACDAAVVARYPGERRTYAQAMLKSKLAIAPLPLGCSWPARSTLILKERIEMLAIKNPPRIRRIVGAGAIALVTGLAALGAWAAQPAQLAAAEFASSRASTSPTVAISLSHAPSKPAATPRAATPRAETPKADVLAQIELGDVLAQIELGAETAPPALGEANFVAKGPGEGRISAPSASGSPSIGEANFVAAQSAALPGR